MAGLLTTHFAFNIEDCKRCNMAVPEDAVFITFENGQEEAERQIKLLCTRVLPAWANLDIGKIQVSRISGGISNLLVKVEAPLPCLPVAVKVFGDKTELLIDREAERRLLLKLNEVGFGATVIALFANGRVEEFLEAATLTPENVADPRFIPHIARRIRTFHELDLSNGDIPVAAAGSIAVPLPHTQPPTTTGSDSNGTSASVRPSTHWEFVFDWLRMAEGLTFPSDPVKQAAFDRVDLGRVRQELTKLRHMCCRVASPKVMCHNDLLPGNILIVRQGKLQKQEPQERQQQVDEELDGRKASTAQPAAANGSHHTNGQVAEDGEVPNGLPHVTGNGCIAERRQQSGRQCPNGGHTDTDMDGVLEGGVLQFIDFEYSCYGPRGFDFGNHFNEYAGFDCVYDRFPNGSQQKAFFRHYLLPGELRRLAKQQLAAAVVAAAATSVAAAAREDCNGTLPQQATANGVSVAAAPPPPVTAPAAPLRNDTDTGGGDIGDAVDNADAEVVEAAEELVLERLCAEACVYALMSHAYWGVWSYIQARYSPIDFDYLGYSEMRWAEYYRRKDEFFALVDRLFPLVPS